MSTVGISYLSARRKVFSFSNDAFVVIDVVLPAVFGLIRVGESRIRA